MWAIVVLLLAVALMLIVGLIGVFVGLSIAAARDGRVPSADSIPYEVPSDVEAVSHQSSPALLSYETPRDQASEHSRGIGRAPPRPLASRRLPPGGDWSAYGVRPLGAGEQAVDTPSTFLPFASVNPWSTGFGTVEDSRFAGGLATSPPWGMLDASHVGSYPMPTQGVRR